MDNLQEGIEEPYGLMFSHSVHQLENSGSVEGHRTLIVHECLQVVAALGRYHSWQHRVNLQEISSENADWNKIPTVAKGNFRFKYSLALTLLGNAQNPAFAHPKLLGHCYDNVYYNGWFIGDLPARGKLPTEEQSKKVYTQEYQEVVTRIENSLELTEVLDYEDVEENDVGIPDPEITQAVAHIPQANAFADVEMQELYHPRVLNPRSAGPGMMLTWSIRTPLDRGRHPQLRQGKTRCWMERPPGHLELLGRVPMKTLAIQKTIKFPGPFFPENPYLSLKTDYFLALD